MLKIISLSVLVVAMLSVNAEAKNQEAEKFGDLNHIEALEKAREWYKNSDNIKVKITPSALIASFPDGSQSSVSIPKDQFFVSIAPWINSTHPCTNHVPTGCTGELVNKNMHLIIKDIQSGEVVKNEEVNTGNDGFIDVWLPSNTSLDVSIHYGNNTGKYLQANEILSTFKNDRTCITSMQFQTQSEAKTHMKSKTQHTDHGHD